MDPDLINPNEDVHPDSIETQTWNELFPGSGIMVGGTRGTSDGLEPNAGGLSPIAQDLKSSNFNAGSVGWRIRSNGDVEFNNGTFRGTLTAASIDIPNTTTADSFHVNSSGDAWWGATTLASGVAWVKKDGSAKFTTGTIGGWTITATQIKSTSSEIVLDSSAKSISVGTGADTITLDSVTGTISSTNSTWTLRGDGEINLKFGGTGADGALAISSGTTTIALGSVATLVKNYTSISITGTGALDFSGAAAGGTLIILKSQGSVTLTSSASALISLNGLGNGEGSWSDTGTAGGGGGEATAASSPGGGGGGGGATEAAGSVGIAGSGGSGNGAAGAAGGRILLRSTFLTQRCGAMFLTTGFKGGAGGAGHNGFNASENNAGAGGNGGGALRIECGGALNFTGTITAKGSAGTDGTTGTNAPGGGGGGGGGGTVHILYNTLTASSGTITATGGAGGTGPTQGSFNAGDGGAGATGFGLVELNVNLP